MPVRKDLTVTEIARLRIVLEGMDDPVFRRIEVATATRLDRLHDVLQAAMGWENYHLYEFGVGRFIRYGLPDPGWPDPDLRSVRRATLSRLLDQAGPDGSFHYTYDFGDDWLHTVTLELVNDADPEVAHPRLLDAEGRCPPEDCGGAGGYARYLEAISDPRHEDHEEMVEWRGPGFDPMVVDEDAIRRALAALGASRRRTAGRKRVAGGRKTAGTRKRES